MNSFVFSASILNWCFLATEEHCQKMNHSQRVSSHATRKQSMQSEMTEGTVTLVPLSMSELKSEALTKKKR